MTLRVCRWDVRDQLRVLPSPRAPSRRRTSNSMLTRHASSSCHERQHITTCFCQYVSRGSSVFFGRPSSIGHCSQPTHEHRGEVLTCHLFICHLSMVTSCCFSCCCRLISPPHCCALSKFVFPIRPNDKAVSARRGLERRGSRSTSTFRGVTHHCRTGRWEAHIWEDGKQVYLGGFDTEEQASVAYDMAALRCRGVTAITNFDISNYERELEHLHEVSDRRAAFRLTIFVRGLEDGSDPVAQRTEQVNGKAPNGKSSSATHKSAKEFFEVCLPVCYGSV